MLSFVKVGHQLNPYFVGGGCCRSGLWHCIVRRRETSFRSVLRLVIMEANDMDRIGMGWSRSCWRLAVDRSHHQWPLNRSGTLHWNERARRRSICRRATSWQRRPARVVIASGRRTKWTPEINYTPTVLYFIDQYPTCRISVWSNKWPVSPAHFWLAKQAPNWATALLSFLNMKTYAH